MLFKNKVIKYKKLIVWGVDFRVKSINIDGSIVKLAIWVSMNIICNMFYMAINFWFANEVLI